MFTPLLRCRAIHSTFRQSYQHHRSFPILSQRRTRSKSSTTSTISRSWIDAMPSKTQPYLHLMRLDKPIGTLLLYYPCAWSITMAAYATNAPVIDYLKYIGIFGAGAIVMRGAGCTINDMWDRNLDKAVSRTKERPLARGDISIPQAWTFLAAQLSVGLGVLLQLNWYSILLGASSMAVVVIYPLMKRITNWPQAVLGLAFNWGALLGWSAVAGTVDWTTCLPLYAGGVSWTLVYDSIYAHQDKIDDVSAGIKSTALLFGHQTRPVLRFLAATSLSLISYSAFVSAHGAFFYGGLSIAAVQLARVITRTNFESRRSCWEGFVGCGWSGFWIWMGALADYLAITVV